MVSLARGGTMPDMALLVGDDRKPEEFNMPPLTYLSPSPYTTCQNALPKAL